MHQESQVSSTIAVDGEFLIRPASDALIIEWKSTCTFHGTLVHRHICQAIDRSAAPAWLHVQDFNGSCVTTFGGLELQKYDRRVELLFTTTFISPRSILLSRQQQDRLREYLAKLLQTQ